MSRFTRATSLFARTVYAELKRSGYSDDDVLRFVNELMDLLLSGRTGGSARLDAPVLLDPETGILDRNALQEILAFEFRRSQQDRRGDGLMIVAVDVVLPDWIPGPDRDRAHELLSGDLADRLRATDSVGRLGGDRYLLVLPNTKDVVIDALEARMRALIDGSDCRAVAEMQLEIRWARMGERTQNTDELLQGCLRRAPRVVMASASSPGEDSRRQPPSGARARASEVVLALGGGAARAASHAGVLSALASAGIRVIGVAGCSGGGVVGAMHSRGIGPDEIVKRLAAFASTPIYRDMRRAYAMFLRASRKRLLKGTERFFLESTLPFQSDSRLFALSQDMLEAFIEYFVGPDCDIASLAFPFSAVAMDLIDERSVVLYHGSLHSALAASCAVAGLFPPQEIGHRLLIDATPLSEIPIGAAHQLGLRAPVIGVHLGKASHHVRAYKSSAEVVTRMYSAIQAELVREQLRQAHVIISVPIQEVGWLDFRQAATSAELGRQATLEALPRILAELRSSGERPAEQA